MTPDELRALADAWDELRALADAWDALCEKTGVDPSSTPGPLARDHAALLDWAERAAAVLRGFACDARNFNTPGRLNAGELLVEWAEMQERPW